jgi:hypothetical protein
LLTDCRITGERVPEVKHYGAEEILLTLLQRMAPSKSYAP